ncbi:MAG TPA: alginate lyase family protein [Bryobacteraceae bacterium]|nr:alginate lyase family protein [Bryobacteraceae bacterium]
MTRALFLLCGICYAAQFDVAAFDRARVVEAANAYLREQPVTITAARSSRSAGGLHDFFSEGDYWWPDPNHPGGPFIQRDGMSNPGNFVEHRRYLMRLSMQVPALAAAWKVTGDARYARHAARHLRAWFIAPATRMNPNLQYAQAISGRFTGRGTGIIDTIHLVEVARAIEILPLSPADFDGVKNWFAEYADWMMTHPYGIDERDAKNNHGTCWVMQVAAFAHLAGDAERLEYCRVRFKTVLIPNQMAADGSFPLELQRTKPYGYSLFNLEAMAAIAQLLSTSQDDLWRFQLPDGRGLRRAVAYMFPYIRTKTAWLLKPDAMYFENWPMRQSSLLFAALAFDEPDYLAVWKTLPADSSVTEVIRNFFIRQPALWVN